MEQNLKLMLRTLQWRLRFLCYREFLLLFLLRQLYAVIEFISAGICNCSYTEKDKWTETKSEVNFRKQDTIPFLRTTHNQVNSIEFALQHRHENEENSIQVQAEALT